MRKFGLFALVSILALGACSKSDPILPGTRVNIFHGSALMVVGKDVPNLPDNITPQSAKECRYTQDSSNIVWDGNKKIFSGFPTANSVKSEQKPVCDGNFVYVGLTTGELVKINPKTRDIAWIADIYRESNVTGGADVLDIIAPIVIIGNDIYVGGLGDAFCKLNKSNGNKRWCVNIGVAEPFIMTDSAVFVLGTNKMLYAINPKDGEIYWGQNVKQQAKPVYKDKIITIGKEQFNAVNGKPIKTK